MADNKFSVLMIGSRRTGKSSVLAAMLNSLEKMEHMTGFQLAADEDTVKLMDLKLAHLENIFYAHHGETEFSTIDGRKGAMEYSKATMETDTYKFSLRVKEDSKFREVSKVEFCDIRGEDILRDMEKGDFTIKERIAGASIIMIAIDSPALMEGKWKEGYGQFHDNVNLPEHIHSTIMKADAYLREKQGEQPILPKLFLFVPIKCEKYYHNGEMAKLNQAIKAGYKGLFTFLEANKEYSVAITPILTLGDVVFNRYKTRTLANGKEVVDTFKPGEREETMDYTPKAPLYKFRKEQGNKFSPLFCEQPLMYLLAFVLASMGKLEEIQKQKAKGKFSFWKLVKDAVFIYLFGLIFYVVAKALVALANDKGFIKQAKIAVKQVKFEEDGYELVYDNMGLKKLVDSI